MKPTRTLNRIDLFNEIAIFQDVCFATDKQGWGRIFDNDGFCGLARPKDTMNSTEFVTNIFGKLVPEGTFRRRTYRSQEQANRALIRYAEKALQQQIRATIEKSQSSPSI